MRHFEIGVVGLGVMGRNLALNMRRRGIAAGGFDVDPAKRAEFAALAGDPAVAPDQLESLVGALTSPRRLFLMVPAGAAVDAVLAPLRSLLEPGDIVIDGGNSLYQDTERRLRELGSAGIRYIGCGVSGGEEGALLGPALMPGGDARAWGSVAPILEAISARAEDGRACADWVGAGGAGHFVKMVHNGIEYADMQLIAEAYAWMQRVLGLGPSEMADQFDDWNQGELQSYLMALTATVLRCTDAQTGRALVDVVLDQAEQKGTGRWASQTALELGVTAPTIADAVFARSLSAQKPERVRAAGVFHAIDRPVLPPAEQNLWLERLRRALFAGKLCAYAQGFALMAAAEAEFHWGLDLGRIAKGWRAGCIIRASFLDDISSAFAHSQDLANLLMAPRFTAAMLDYEQDWRAVVGHAALAGVWSPCLMSALAYFDGYRSARLSANVLQAQRDAFGAHGYRRIDREGQFHSDWRPVS